MKLGVNTVLFGGYDLQTALNYIQFTGYEGIELSSIVGMAEHLSDTASNDKLTEIRGMADRAELELYCIEAATDILVEANQERTKRVFERAEKLGIPMVTVGSSGKSDDEEQTVKSIKVIEKNGTGRLRQRGQICAEASLRPKHL